MCTFPGRKEENVLFNDVLNTFYLRLYGVRYTVKDHSDRERGNLLPPLHGLLFPINSKGSFICTIPQTEQYIPRPLLHQSWSTGWNKKSLNGSTMKDRSEPFEVPLSDNTFTYWFLVTLMGSYAPVYDPAINKAVHT